MKNSLIEPRKNTGSPILRRASRWIIGLAALLVIAMFLGWGITKIIPEPGNRQTNLPHPITDEMVKRGAYLARVGDCVACHSTPGKPEFSGGQPIASPIGGMIPPNITPDRETGIGRYSFGDFDRAVRYGIAPSGDTLYPAMPWISYARLSRQDMAALYAYFMHGVAPVSAPRAPDTIPWPLSLRWPMTWWRWSFAPTITPPDSQPNDPVALGAYYVEGLGHCGACHTPRALTLQETAFEDTENHQFLSGGQVIDGYSVPSLRGEQRSGLGQTRSEEIVELLKTGRTDKTATFGPMSDVVSHSTQYMSDSDLRAIAAYLHSLVANKTEDKPYYDLSSWTALSRNAALPPGGKQYLSYCEGCHVSNGLGYRKKFPALALNSMVNIANPDALIKIVLEGGTQANTAQNAPVYSMPAYADQLSDRDIAEILTFIRSSWGNQAPEVSAAQVSAVRQHLAPHDK